LITLPFRGGKIEILTKSSKKSTFFTLLLLVIFRQEKSRRGSRCPVAAMVSHSSRCLQVLYEPAVTNSLPQKIFIVHVWCTAQTRPRFSVPSERRSFYCKFLYTKKLLNTVFNGKIFQLYFFLPQKISFVILLLFSSGYMS